MCSRKFIPLNKPHNERSHHLTSIHMISNTPSLFCLISDKRFKKKKNLILQGEGKIPKSIHPPHSASLSTTLSTLCCCESHPCVTHCFPPQFQYSPPHSHKSRLISGNIETFHCYPAPFHKTTKSQIIHKLLRLLSVVTRTLK
jgi:hypothetical protein